LLLLKKYIGAGKQASWRSMEESERCKAVSRQSADRKLITVSRQAIGRQSAVMQAGC